MLQKYYDLLVARVCAEFEHNAVIFLSGVQNFGNGDTWGGFGDIAANIHNAFLYKRRNPGARVTLMVTDYTDIRFMELKSKFPNIVNTSSIVESLLPSLQSHFKGYFQEFNGVEFYFPVDGLVPARFVDWRTVDLPFAGCAIVLSDNRSRLGKIAEHCALMSVAVDEPGRDREPTRRNSVDNSAEAHCMNAGVFNLGLYVDASLTNDALLIRQKRVLEQLRIRHDTIGDKSICFVYPGREIQAERYFDAIQMIGLATGRNIVALTLGAEISSDTSRWSNIEFVNYHQVDHLTFSDFVLVSDLPPVVTGCVSLSNAINFSVLGRAFVYSKPSWKEYAARDMVQYFADKSAGLANFCLPLGSFHAKVQRSIFAGHGDLDTRRGIEDLASVMMDQNFQRAFSTVVSQCMCELSLVKNLEVFIQWIELRSLLYSSGWSVELDEELIFKAIRHSSNFAEFSKIIHAHIRRIIARL